MMDATGGPKAFCPNPECGEEVEKEEDGTFPEFCDECGKPLPTGFDQQHSCPKCNTPRKKKKDSKYAPFCRKCAYEYVSGTKLGSELTAVKDVDPPKSQTTTSSVRTQSTSANAKQTPEPLVTVRGNESQPKATPDQVVPENTGQSNTRTAVPECSPSATEKKSAGTTPPSTTQTSASTTTAVTQATTSRSRTLVPSSTADAYTPPVPPQTQSTPPGSVQQTAKDSDSAKDVVKLEAKAQHFGSDAQPEGQLIRQSSDELKTGSSSNTAFQTKEDPPKQSYAQVVSATSETPSDDDTDIIEKFAELKDKLTMLTEAMAKPATFTKDERNAIDKVCTKADSIESTYQAAVSNLRHASNDKEATKKGKVVVEATRAMRKLLSKLPGHIHDAIAKCEESTKSDDVHEAPDLNNAASPQPSRSSCRRLEFWAVLSQEAKSYFTGKNLVLEVRAQCGHYEWVKGPPLATLREENGIWKGECATISKRERYLEYKYRFSTAGHVLWEKLYNTYNRHILLSEVDDHLTIYDGVVIPDVKKNIVKGLFDYATSAELNERQRGYQSMLPNWISEIRKGTPIEKLTTWVDNATNRHVFAVTGFNPFYDTRIAKKDVVTCLKDYVKGQLKRHTELFDDKKIDPPVLCLAMVGLIHAAKLPLEMAELYMFKHVSALIDDTMAQFTDGSTTLATMNPLLPEALFANSAQCRKFADSVLVAMHVLSKENVNNWILLIPIYHKLMMVSVDTRSVNDSNEVWWGTDGFDGDVQTLKASYMSSLHVWKNWSKMLQPYFGVDNLLPYTFLALLTRGQLVDCMYELSSLSWHNEIPIDGILACSKFHLQKRISYHDKKLEVYQALYTHLKSMQPKTTFMELKPIPMIAELSASLLTNFHTTSSNGSCDHWQDATVVIETYLTLLAIFPNTYIVDEECGRPLMEFVDKVRANSKAVLNYYDYQKMMEHEVKLWDAQFQCISDSQHVQSWWTKTCHTAFASRIKKMSNPSYFLERILAGRKMKSQAMNDVVTEYLLSIPEWWLQPMNADYLKCGEVSAELCLLVDNAVTTGWTMQEDDNRISIVLNLLNKRQTFLTFWNFCQRLSKLGNTDLSTSSITMACSVSAYEYVMETIIEATITLGDFEKLSPMVADAVELCTVSDKLVTKRDDLRRSFQRRQEELNTYQVFVAEFSDLWQCCKGSFRDGEPIDKWLARPLHGLIFGDTVNSMTVKVICVLIPDDVRDLLRSNKYYKHHKLFREIFILSLDKKVSWLEIIQIFQESMTTYDQLIETILDGTIDVKTIKALTTKYYGGNKDDLIKQLPTMISDRNVCEERCDQINICVELDAYYKGAEAIIAMVQMFELTGDFSHIEVLAQAKGKSLQLRKISRDIVKRADLIKNIGPSEIDCLDAFAECSEFVTWVRGEVQKNDIRVFVDLASSSLGEDDLAAQKTRYLLNTLTGYTPLLYDFIPEKADFDSFLELCRRVWHNMDTNSELPENLRWSASQTEFFKRVKTHYGSTEITAVSQAEAINATGLYEIGNIPGYSTEFRSLDDVIRLTCAIPEKTEDGETEDKKKTYSYTELKDLQSRLALVAGDKQKESGEVIKKFDEMRDAVENLGNAYIEIKREGCIQFDDMMVVVHCDPLHAAGVEIRLQSIQESMIGRTAEKIALEHCQNVYTYLNGCLQKWRASMDIQRSNTTELNFYTTEQLVILRKELGQFVCQKDASLLPKALPLLAMIHAVMPEELLDIITRFEEISEVEEEIQETRLTYETMKQAQRDYVDYIVAECSNISRDIAVEIFIELGDDASDLDKVMEWYEQRCREQKEKDGAGETSDDVLVKLMKGSDSQRTLQQRLDKLWDEFIDHTSKSIKNFLGIPHLSYVLRQLKELSGIPQVKRKLPSWLERGKPVLIGERQDNTFKMVLTIYETDKEFRKPTRNEVLVCTKRTRKDEVALFLNRALNDPLSFYCMVNCHLIRYEVCRTIENRLNNMADQKVKDYGLAFLYAEESKGARIKAYLDKYLARNSQVVENSKLLAYVRDILHVTDEAETTACCVDPDRSSVRLIRSSRAGVGKSLQAKNLVTQLRTNHGLNGKDITIALHKTVDMDSVIARLTEEFAGDTEEDTYDTIHLDIAHEVESGVDELLFNMIVLRSLVNAEGVMWQANQRQYCIIECMPFTRENGTSVHEVLDFLPTIECVTPTEAYRLYQDPPPQGFIGFDEAILQDRQWQLVLKHLMCYANKQFTYEISRIGNVHDPQKAVALLIRNCGLIDPTWSELRHYVHFLSSQLRKVINSPFCGTGFVEELPGFKSFVIDFMLKMAKDFATRSLKIAEETPGRNFREVTAGDTGRVFDDLSMKKTWEQSNYPYLFFNEDGETFTTLGFYVKRGRRGHMAMYNKDTGEQFAQYTMKETLYNALLQNKLPICEDFNCLPRQTQLQKLRGIMAKNIVYGERVDNPGQKPVFVTKLMFAVDDDPDPNYVLTMDNAKKIIAIHQRLRVDIPVIIMGETGCGKTKLIDFMARLQVPTELKGKLQTMVIVKIHGGTTEKDIIEKICKAQELAEKNQQEAQDYATRHNSEQVPTVYTIIFLDEVNTTEAIGLVKEIICDNRMNGVPLPCDSKLKIIAACNPYRRHSEAMIEKLKTAGLGYNVGEEETADKFGKIPMRHLVYRVQALSQSLLPLVWDFGTLQSKPATTSAGSDVTTSVEGAYIKQMIIKFDATTGPNGIHFRTRIQMIAELLSLSQGFMREQKDECSFVSLRDIQRLLEVSNWFYTQRKHLFPAMDELKTSKPLLLTGDSHAPAEYHRPNDVVRSVLLAVGICYLARLETLTRVLYTKHISGKIKQLIANSRVDGGKCLTEQVNLCQDMLIDVVVDSKQHKNIAKNKALKENVFMMIVCIENRIPLFVIGKPGSSKSLSKSMVFDSMKGDLSRNPLFKEMKNAYMVSFQCSRHATPSGIVGVFRHCAVYQKEQDLNKFVSVVVLDEVGLAEDSENMPLKALHPLLEDGCVGSEEPEPYKKCAFIGISNWALDPAKMNRGIFIQIGSPADNELDYIAREICRSSTDSCDVEQMISFLSKSYLSICQAKKPEGRNLTEFFGLRDFYSLIKMVVGFARSTGILTRQQLEHSIMRNFGGFDPDLFSPMDIFNQNCPTIQTLPDSDQKGPPTDSIGLIQSSLFSSANGMESRYLLILTENLSVLSVILNEFAAHSCQPEVVFGSRFSDDLSYTQVCHNLYRIKMCMAMGRPVILLNLDDLYESLYDALNQYFSSWGNKKFVDLGLGTHRVKAYVHDSFRLVLIADKNKVHSQFPIPLINRLEKHYVSATSLLSRDQKGVKEDLEQWMKHFVKPSKELGKSCPTLCDGCGSALSQPYRMPCSEQHYIGECCREEIFQNQTKKCPGESCTDGDIDESYEWTIDLRALESRQYFENSSVSSSFIGYSSETTALVVRRATDDVWETRTKYDKMWTQVFEYSKTYLLQCATAESILRLNRTVLQKEAADIQRIYMVDQRHENLLQYLEHELSGVEDKSLQIQVTSFAEIMSSRDVNSLSQHLNLQEDIIVIESLYLKDYPKESLFTDAVRKFYEKPVNKIKLLIIKCESANENVELLDSVRYIVQREIAAVPEQANHTVLLLSLARGHTFSGYQGGEWRCVHIDDPRSPVFKLPSLRKCMEMKPCELLAGVLNSQKEAEEFEPEPGDGPPPLAYIDEDEEYLDTELQYDDRNHAVNSTHVDSVKITIEDVLQFIEHCLPRAVSIIKCDQSYDRVAELKKLIEDNSDFQNAFLTHVYSLLLEQDKFSKADWVQSDAAKASNMKKSETLRHALEDSLERSFRPAIAAVIAFIDPYNNLKLLKSEPVLTQLWIDVFTQCDKLGLSYEQLTRVAADKMPTSRLPNSYMVRQVCAFTNRFPFSWIVKDGIDQLIEVSLNTGLTEGLYIAGRWLVKPFKATAIGEIVMADHQPDQTLKMVDAYIHDFVYMTHPCGSDTEHWIVEQALHKCLTDRYHGKALIPHVHIAYKDMHHEMTNMASLLKISFMEKHLPMLVKESIVEMIEVEEELVPATEPSPTAKLATDPPNDGEIVEADPEAMEISPADTEGVDDDPSVSDSATPILPGKPTRRIRFDVVALQVLISELYDVGLQTLQKETQKWIDQVDQCKLLMEKILDSGIGNYNDSIAINCRSSWTKLELKKLYVEHVILPSDADIQTGKRKLQRILTFTKAVKEDNFHCELGFNQVVSSLTKLVEAKIRELYKDCPVQCPVCTNFLGTPAKLPCGHLICESCVRETKLCPQAGCGENIPDGYTYDPAGDNIVEEQIKDLEEFRNGLNRFFMHFVSELVFSPGIIPEIGIIKWLAKCVTFRDMTKEFSLFNCNNIIDPTPVLRSFLLKLLLQCQDDPAVEQYLDETIRDWGDKNPLDQLPKMVMLMNCHKDLNAQIGQEDSIQMLQNRLTKTAADYHGADHHQCAPSILALTSIAEMQSLMSKSVEEILQDTAGKAKLLDSMKELLDATQTNGNYQPGYFVVRQLITFAGEGYVKDLINTPRNFLVPANVQEVLASFTVPDVLSVFGGEGYRSIKSLIGNVIAVSGSQGELENAIRQLLKECEDDNGLLLHTLFTRITRTLTQNVPVSKHVRELLQGAINATLPDEQWLVKSMSQLLLEDDAVPLEMNVTQSKGVSFSMLVLHLFTSISQCKKGDDLYPLTELSTQPALAAKHYLPTMMDDPAEIAQAAYLKAFVANRHVHNQFKPYLCPNGHIYFIGDCGRPVQISAKCPCGAMIGGKAYDRLQDNNREITADMVSAIRSQTGHILGHAVKRSLTAQAERELSPLSCAVLRCLLHLAMYTSSLFHPNELLTVIEPTLSSVEELGQFLEAHIQIDLQQISQCCEESTDSCILLLHDVIDRLAEASDTYRTLDVCVLESIENRRIWEMKFDAKYIQPTFDERTNCLRRIKSELTTGTPRDLADVLSTDKNAINEENFLASPGLWEYVRPLTLTSVQNFIGKDYPLLEAMVTNCDRLIAVKSLPDILSFIKMLCDKFHSQLSRAQAEGFPIDRFITHHIRSPEPRLKAMMQSFVKAWNIAITCNDFPIADAKPLSDNPPLSEFLIDKHKRQTSHPLQLIRFLIETHNRLISVADQNRKSLPISEITNSLLVSLANRDEIFSLISSHSEYHLGTTADHQYNLQAAEREATLRYIGTRPKIKYIQDDLPFFMYQEDFSLWNQMEVLAENQKRLDADAESSITGSVTTTIQSLTTHLKNLSIVINYLSVMPQYDTDSSLQCFMERTVGTEPAYLKPTVMIKHVVHVWLLLKYTQTNALMYNSQKPFDDVEVQYMHELPDQAQATINEMCTYNSPRTKILLQELFEYIILRLNKEAIAKNLVDPDMRLHDALMDFVVRQNIDDPERHEHIEEQLPELPAYLEVKHAAATWSCVWRRYSTAIRD